MSLDYLFVVGLKNHKYSIIFVYRRLKIFTTVFFLEYILTVHKTLLKFFRRFKIYIIKTSEVYIYIIFLTKV